MCHNCNERPKTFGCFCGKCLAGMRKDKKNQKRSDEIWKAAENGSGNLWRFNY